MGIEVVVIGGSAGALHVLLELAGGLSSGLAAPIVVVLHLQPHQPSLVPALLARACRYPVHEVEDKQAMQANTIYVAPPNYHVLIGRDRMLALSVDAPVHFSRPSIDVLFESAAASLGAAVMGIVLSGANEDGAYGLARIHQAGGAAIVQDPATAKHPTMPAAAADRVGAGVRILSVEGLVGLFATPGDGMTSSQDVSR
jgi:two-component system chemotaxis response regulator CheB